MLVFDASSYFTRRQADLRYVRLPFDASQFLDGNGKGTLPGSFIAPSTITGEEIREQAVELRHMLGDVRPPKIIAADQPQPVLPDPVYPVGSLIFWMSGGGALWVNRNNTSWELAIRPVDLNGKITRNQLFDSIKVITLVDSLPTIEQDPVTHQATNYQVNDLVALSASGKQYRLIDAGGFNYVWDAVIKAVNIDVTGGKIAAPQIDVDNLTAAVVSSAAFKTDLLDAGIATVDQLGINNATADSIASRRIQSKYIDFTSLSGDTACVNWLTAGMVQAGAITTDKLIVGSFDNLCEDGAFNLPATAGSWIPDPGGWQVTSGYARTGTYSAVKTGGWTDTIVVNRMVFDVKDGDKVYLEGWGRSFGANGDCFLVVQYYADRACTQILGQHNPQFDNAAAAAGWNFASGSYTVPAGARWARVLLYVRNNTAGIWSVDDIYARKKIGSAYIDSLSADIIQAGTLDCSKVTVINLDASSITTGTLSATRIDVANLYINGTNVTGVVANATNAGFATNATNATNAVNATYASVYTGTLSADKITAGKITVNSATVGITIESGSVSSILTPYGAASYNGSFPATGISYLPNIGGVLSLTAGNGTPQGVSASAGGGTAPLLSVIGAKTITLRGDTGDVLCEGFVDFRGGTTNTSGAYVANLIIKVNGTQYVMPFYTKT